MEENQQEKSLITQVLSLFQLIINRTGDVCKLALLEAKLTTKSFIMIMMIILLVGFLFISLWLGLVITLSFYLLINSWLLSDVLLLLVLLHGVLILGCMLSIHLLKKNLGFPATRKQLSIKEDNPL